MSNAWATIFASETALRQLIRYMIIKDRYTVTALKEIVDFEYRNITPETQVE
jgi:hypothetical protein